jgi:hypothetical protein
MLGVQSFLNGMRGKPSLFPGRGRFLRRPANLTTVRYYFSHHVEPIFLGNVGVNK